MLRQQVLLYIRPVFSRQLATPVGCNHGAFQLHEALEKCAVSEISGFHFEPLLLRAPSQQIPVQRFLAVMFQWQQWLTPI